VDNRIAIVKQVTFYALLALGSYLLRSHFDTLPGLEERIEALEARHVTE
jgi:Zn-dependent protease with chaperone function